MTSYTQNPKGQTSRNENILDNRRIDGVFKPNDLLDQIQALLGKNVAQQEPIQEYLNFITQFVLRLSADMHPDSKIQIKANFGNIVKPQYQRRIHKSYMQHKVVGKVVYGVIGVLMVVMLISGINGVKNSASTSFLLFFLMALIGGASQVISVFFQARFFGAPIKYNDKYYGLTLLEIKAQLYNGNQVQLKVNHTLIAINRIRKRLKMKKLNIVKHVVKIKNKQVLRLRVDVPRSKFTIDDTVWEALFNHNKTLEAITYAKVKTKSSEKKHTVIIQMADAITFPRKPYVKLSESKQAFPKLKIHLVTKILAGGVFQKIDSLKVAEAQKSSK